MVEIGEQDQLKWVILKDGSYSSSVSWDALREKQDLVGWYRLVWFPLAIPKHYFISWLAIKNALITGEKMLHWCFKGRQVVFFCRNSVEDRNHIFFQCSFSKRLWRNSMESCNVVGPPLFWDDVITMGLHNWRKKTLLAYVCRLVFGATIYHLWKTRNEIQYGGLPWTEDQILQRIQFEVRTRVLGKGKFKRNPSNLELCCNWGFHNCVLV